MSTICYQENVLFIDRWETCIALSCETLSFINKVMKVEHMILT